MDSTFNKMWLFLLTIYAIQGQSRMQCTTDLALPYIKRYNEIDCDLNSKPTDDTCKNKNKCVPTKSGAIRIKNCLPEKNSSIADMLISFRRNETNGKNESLIPGEN